MESQHDEMPQQETVVGEPPVAERIQYEEYSQSADAPLKPKNNNMAMASMIMGILGLVLSCCCMGTVFGGLAILFACLSKTEGKLESKAKAGLIMGIIGILLSIVMLIVIMAAGAMEDTQWYDMIQIMIQTKYLA